MLRMDDGQNGVHRCVQFVLRVEDVIVKQVDLFEFLMYGFEAGTRTKASDGQLAAILHSLQFRHRS